MDFDQNGLKEEHVANMLPQIGLDGVAYDKKKYKKKEELSHLMEDADDDVINAKTEVDIPRNIRKNIAKMETLSAKINNAEKLGYEADTVKKLKAALLKCKNELSRDTKSMTPQEKSEIKKLITLAKKSVTEDDMQHEKNVTESFSGEIEFEYDVVESEDQKTNKKIKEVKIPEKAVLAFQTLNVQQDSSQSFIISAIKKYRSKFRKIKDSDVPKAYKISEPIKKSIFDDGNRLLNVAKSEFKKIQDNAIEKKEGKVITTFKDYLKFNDKSESVYYKNKKGDYLYFYSKLVCTYEAPFGQSLERNKIENYVRQILNEIASECKELKDNRFYAYFYHNPYYETSTHGCIIIYNEKILRKQNETKLSPIKECVFEDLRNQSDTYYFKAQEAIDKFELLGDNRFELVRKGNTYLMESTDKKIEALKEEIIQEAAQMEHEIKKAVDIFNRKGYTVKYASPGHRHLRKEEDQEADGVYKGKLYSDARVVFDKEYKFPRAPKYWYWKEVPNHVSYLDIEELPYHENDGTPDEAFVKWKSAYMKSLEDYANSLPENKNGSDSSKDLKEMSESATILMDEIFYSIQ